jgi:hypothetical protein
MLNAIFSSIIIITLIISVICIFIWIFTNIKFVHFNSKYSNISSIFIIIVLIIFLVFFPIILTNTVQISEKFDNPPINNGFNLQYGKSGIEPTGTITFKNSFQNTPKVFTQIIGNDSSTNNVYSVQVFNITNTGFNYSKNMMANSTSDGGKFTMAKLAPSTIEPFDWIAFG